ncbi:MAG TPA: PepSY-like domain-containing protein [Puia sp.]|nr:PepSY-like domain-containing protein [Puia sp.]
MKKIFLVIAIALVSNIIVAQNNKEIPQTVITAFQSKYPSAEIKKWKTGKEDFVAEFNLEKKKYRAYYSSNAEWIRTETKIKLSSKLPQPVKTALHKSEYASWYINEIKQIEKPGKNMYTIHVDDGNKLSADHHDALKTDYLLSFSDTGELIKKQRIH